MGASKQQRSKTSKKVKQDSFLRKEWRHVFVPGYFSGKRDIGVTVTNKIARGKVPLDYVQGRIWEVSHADITKEVSHNYRIFKFRTIAAGDDVYTQFAGMRMTRDKVDSVLRKYRTMVRAYVDVKTNDGFILRLFSMGFIKKIANNHSNHAYAKQHKCREIRDAMIKCMTEATESNTIEQISKDIVEEKIEASIVEACKSIYQVEGVYVTKIKVIKAPALTEEQIKALHIPKAVADASSQAQETIERPTEE
jgi:small subunit ribosomal protein S3Ae